MEREYGYAGQFESGRDGVTRQAPATVHPSRKPPRPNFRYPPDSWATSTLVSVGAVPAP